MKWKNATKVAVLLGVLVFICVVTVFSGIDTASEVYKQDVVEDDDAIHEHLQPASIDYSVLPLPSRHDENYTGKYRPHRENKRRRDISQNKSMESQKLLIDNGNCSRIDHEKRETVKEVNERRLGNYCSRIYLLVSLSRIKTEVQRYILQILFLTTLM